MLNLTLTSLLFLVSVSTCRLSMFNKGSKIFTLCKIVNWLQYFSFQLIFCPLFLEVYAIVFIFCCLKVIIIHNIFGCKELHCNFFFLQKYKLHLVTCKMLLSYWNEHLMIELEPDLNSQNIVLQREIPTLKVYLQSGVHLNTIHSFLCLFFFAKVNNSQIVQ
jgi:hypothetical protein